MCVNLIENFSNKTKSVYVYESDMDISVTRTKKINFLKGLVKICHKTVKHIHVLAFTGLNKLMLLEICLGSFKLAFIFQEWVQCLGQ